MSSVLTALIGAYGWRHCLRLLSAGTFVLGVLAAWTLREPQPWEIQTGSDADTEKGREAPTRETLLSRPLAEPESLPQSAVREAETRLADRPKPDSNGTVVETRLVSGKSSMENLELESAGESFSWKEIVYLPSAWLFSAAIILANNAYTFEVINLVSAQVVTFL